MESGGRPDDVEGVERDGGSIEETGRSVGTGDDVAGETGVRRPLLRGVGIDDGVSDMIQKRKRQRERRTKETKMKGNKRSFNDDQGS